MDEFIQEISLEALNQTQLGDKLKTFAAIFRKAQEIIVASLNDSSDDWLKMVRCGTVAAFAILTKVANGKPIGEFTKYDWNEISAEIANYAILEAGQYYSMRVFDTYADYVRVSVKVLNAKKVPKEKIEAIEALADEIKFLDQELLDGNIKEVDYTEKCLWVLLEAMVKLITTYTSQYVGENAGELIQNLSMFTFEYARYAMYKKEQAILTMYLEHQERVDEELTACFEEYRNEFARRQEEFAALIDNAFEDNFRQRLQSSVNVAKFVGVADEEILDTMEKIDDFFM